MYNISRNELCPCGSGKKYKKCCMLLPRKIKREDDFISFESVIDYGPPLPDQAFFSKNGLHELSAPRLVYSCLLNPGIERIADTAARQIFRRGAEELRRIETAKDTETLIVLLKNNPDTLNHLPLIDRLVTEKEQSVQMILQELKQHQNSSFIEIAVRILHRAGINCSQELIGIIKTGKNRKAYAIT